MNELGDDLIGDEHLVDEIEISPPPINVSGEMESPVTPEGGYIKDPTLETFDPIILSVPKENVAVMETLLLNTPMPVDNSSLPSDYIM